jgi:holo-[acyl-carrier protein] synthase
MIGIDIVNIDRFEKFVERFEKKALQRFLCDDEISILKSTSSAAGFFAAKEAISKALQTGISKECSFKDIKIHKDSKNAPYFTLSHHLIEKYNITKTSLSISHDGGFAIAVAVITSNTNTNKPISH